VASLRNLMIRLGIDYDETGSNRLSKGLDNVSKRIDRTSTALDKMRVPAFATGLLSAAGAASSFAVALAPVAASAVALPAAFAASKVAAGTLKVAMIGVGDAMSAVASGDAKALNEALKKLSPNAQNFVRSSAGFVKSFEPIRKAVQDKLFQGLGKEIDPLAKNLLPTAERGMKGVATEFNRGAKEAIAFGQTPIAKGALNTVFKMTRGVLSEATTAVRPFLGAVARLVVLGTPLAQRMASWAINGVKAGAAFVNSEEGAKKLATWVQKAGDILQRLGNISKNVGVGLISFFAQAKSNSSDFLGTLERLTAKFAAWAQSAQGQQQAANAFKILGDVARQLATILPLLLGPLGALAKLITSLPPGVQGTATTFLAFGVVAGALGGKLTILGTTLFKGASLATQFAGGLIKGSSALANNASIAAKAGGALNSFVGMMSRGIVATAQMVVQLSAQAGAWLLNTTRTVASTAATVLATVASKALAIGIRLVNLAMRANPIGIVITLLLALVAIIVTAYKKNETFRNIVNKVWAFIKNFVGNAIQAIVGWFKGLVNWFTVTLPNGLRRFWDVNRLIWNTVTTWIRQKVDAVKGFLKALGNFITVTVPNAFKTGVAAIGRFWSKVQEIAKRPVSFIVNTVYNKGIARIWNWVASKVNLPQLPYIQGFAKGGILPGFSRKDNQIIAARSGEGILVPEAVKELGSDFIMHANQKGGLSAIANLLGFAGDPGALKIPGFENGGIVGFVTGFLGKAKDFFVSGFMKAAKAALNPILSVMKRTVGATPFGALVSSAVERVVNGVLGKFTNFENELGGGGGMKAVHAARSQIGVPYSWGGGGPGGPSFGIGRGAGTRGFDCSGLTEYAWWQALKKSIGGTTYAQKGILKRISGPRPGAVGQPHPGHTYLATERGTIIEAPYTGARVREVGMRSTPYWGWPPWSFDNGGVWAPGTAGFNGTREPEYVFTRRQIQSGFSPNVFVEVHVDPITGKVTYEVLKDYKRRNGNRKLGLD
jgi:NlpC/P60 family protein